MTSVSIMMPAWKFPSFEKFNGFLKENFEDSEDSIEYYELLPVSFDRLASSKNIIIKFKASDFTFKNVESLISENRQMQIQLERAKETIKNLSSEYQKLTSQADLLKDMDPQKTFKKVKKAKRLEDDNKKLRHLLKGQLENSERLRMETQTTIEALKDEFSLLVKELANLQKKNGEWKGLDEHPGIEKHGKGAGLFTENKHHDFIPKIDRLEFLLGDQHNMKIHADQDFQKR